MNTNLTIYPPNTQISTDIIKSITSKDLQNGNCYLFIVPPKINSFNVGDTVNIPLYYRGPFATIVNMAVVFYGMGENNTSSISYESFKFVTRTPLPSLPSLPSYYIHSYGSETNPPQITNQSLTQPIQLFIYHQNDINVTDQDVIIYLGDFSFTTSNAGLSFFSVRLINVEIKTPSQGKDIVGAIYRDGERIQSILSASDVETGSYTKINNPKAANYIISYRYPTLSIPEFKWDNTRRINVDPILIDIDNGNIFANPLDKNYYITGSSLIFSQSIIFIQSIYSLLHLQNMTTNSTIINIKTNMSNELSYPKDIIDSIINNLKNYDLSHPYIVEDIYNCFVDQTKMINSYYIKNDNIILPLYVNNVTYNSINIKLSYSSDSYVIKDVCCLSSNYKGRVQSYALNSKIITIITFFNINPSPITTLDNKSSGQSLGFIVFNIINKNDVIRVSIDTFDLSNNNIAENHIVSRLDNIKFNINPNIQNKTINTILRSPTNLVLFKNGDTYPTQLQLNSLPISLIYSSITSTPILYQPKPPVITPTPPPTIPPSTTPSTPPIPTPTPTTPPISIINNNNKNKVSSSLLSINQIIGIVVGIVGFIIVIILIYILYKKYKNNKKLEISGVYGYTKL